MLSMGVFILGIEECTTTDGVFSKQYMVCIFIEGLKCFFMHSPVDPRGAHQSPAKTLFEFTVCESVVPKPAREGFKEESDNLGSCSAVAFKFWGALVCPSRLLRRAVQALRREGAWHSYGRGKV